MSSHISKTGIQLRTFPSADPVFHAFACDALEALRKPWTDALQDRIRARYPTAVVRAQEDLARRGGEPTVWYAFRYGTVAHGPPGMPVIDWDGPDLAWAILDEGRHFVDLNAALAAIVELPAEQILGRAVEEFTNPEDPSIREDLAALWQQFAVLGDVITVQGEAAYYHEEVPVEYVRDGGLGAQPFAFVTTLEYGPDHDTVDPFDISVPRIAENL